MLDAGVTREVQDGLPVLLKRLPREDLGEEIRRIGLASDMLDDDATGSAQLTHLEELTVNMSGISRRGEAVA